MGVALGATCFGLMELDSRVLRAVLQLGSLGHKLGSACAVITAKQRHVCLGPSPVESLEG